MATTVTYNAVNYTIPAVGDTGWGPNVGSYLVALATGSLTKAGGAFALSADANFGSNFGLLSKYFTSVSASAASTGVVRLANTDAISWRNIGNSADIALKPGADGVLQYGGVDIATISATQILTNKTISGTSNTLTNIGNSALSNSSITIGSTAVSLGGTAATVAGLTLTSPTINTPTLNGSGGLLTLPAGPDTLVGRATTDTLTNKTLSGASNTFSNIPNSATTAASANTASAIVARDSSGNFGAGTITASLTGHASLDLPLTGGTMSGALNMGSNLINAVASPVSGTDAVNKNYVDNKVNGISWRPEVNLLDSTHTTKPATTATTIDGTTVTDGMRVLFTALTSGNNEVYSAAVAGGNITWTLATDGQAGTGAPTAGDAVLILSGTTYGQSGWDYNGTQWVQFNGANQVQAGTGLTKSGNTISVSTVPIANGGTGQTSQTAAFDALSPLTTKGDIVAYSGSHNVRIPIGSDGQVPVADSTQANGLAWKTLQQGAKNYITYNNFENNSTTGWSLGTATLTSSFPSGTPTFGSGASANLSIATVSSGQLAGSYSLSLASSAASNAGNFLASQAYTIDAEDQAKVLAFKFFYQAQSGAGNCNFSGTASNSFGVAIYDVTNSAWIMPAGVWNLVQSSGVGIAQGTFQTPSNMTQFRIVLFNANATAGAATLYLDDFYVGPQALAFGPAMSDLKSYIPTLGAGFGTATNNIAYYKQEGDMLLIRGSFTTGTVSASTASISLPSGPSIDTTKVTINNTTSSAGQQVGVFFGTGDSSAAAGAVVLAPSTSTTLLYIGNNTNSAAPLIPSNGTLVGSNSVFSYEARVPIVGWSSNTVMSADTDTRVVAMQVSQASPTITLTSSTSVVKFTSTPSQDTHGGYSTSTGLYTVPVSGYYRVTGTLGQSAAYTTNQNASVFVQHNGTAVLQGVQTASGSATAGFFPVVMGTIYCNAGDTLALAASNGGTTPSVAGGTANNYLNIERLSGPAVVQASEKVYLQYTGNAGTALTANTTNIDWATKVVDSHAAWSGTVFTAPKPGMYDLQGSVNITAGSTNSYYIYVNGVQKIILSSGPVSYQTKGVSGSIYLNGGDQLSVRSDTGVTLSNSATVHWLSITSQG